MNDGMDRLIDPFGRDITYLRLSVTDRCDFRCGYCMPGEHRDFTEPASWLGFDEIERVARAFVALGTRRIRLTGGEPLTRRGLPDLAARLAAIPGLADLSLSTNGSQLARQAAALRAAGVQRLNISLDTLDADRFAAITRHGDLARVLAGIEAAQAAGFAPIKINMVVQAGVNEDEVEAMSGWCAARGFVLRLIETMPLGGAGCGNGARHVSLAGMRERLARGRVLLPDISDGGGPARYVRLSDSGARIGFITPLSQHFCATCNRVRLSAEGTLYLCLGQDDKAELGPLLRAGGGDAELQDAIRAAIARKPERHEFNERPHQVVRLMSQTGG
jgi:cyclic pyranopterin phosphate synthase